jgi:hypothetical protein
MSHQARQIALNARRLPGQEPLLCRAMTGCDCGCGLPDRFEFTIGRVTICISDVKQVDALIEELKEGRRKLWG